MIPATPLPDFRSPAFLRAHIEDTLSFYLPRAIRDWDALPEDDKDAISFLLLQNGDDPVPKFAAPLVWKRPDWLGPSDTRPPGSPLGTVGDSGNARGKPPHLHYAILSLLPYPWRADGSSTNINASAFCSVKSLLSLSSSWRKVVPRVLSSCCQPQASANCCSNAILRPSVR